MAPPDIFLKSSEIVRNRLKSFRKSFPDRCEVKLNRWDIVANLSEIVWYNFFQNKKK